MTKPIYLLSTGLVSAGVIEKAAQKGITLDALAFIHIENLGDAEEMKGLAGRPLVVAFTSVNAVNAVQRWVPGPTGWRVYCISGATCGAVVSLFGEAAVVGKARSAGELAETIIRQETGREILFLCGDHRREELPSILRRAGFSVVEEVVYRTLLTPHKVERNYDGIAFFSPSAVESFFSVNETAAGTPLFAIGPTTAAAIRARCTNPVITAGEPDRAMLIGKMTDHFINKR
jgi:uroporphyrinogen-III synthase